MLLVASPSQNVTKLACTRSYQLQMCYHMHTLYSARHTQLAMHIANPPQQSNNIIVGSRSGDSFLRQSRSHILGRDSPHNGVVRGVCKCKFAQETVARLMCRPSHLASDRVKCRWTTNSRPIPKSLHTHFRLSFCGRASPAFTQPSHWAHHLMHDPFQTHSRLIPDTLQT